MGRDDDHYKQQDQRDQGYRDTDFRDDQIQMIDADDRRIRANRQSEDVSESIKGGDIDNAGRLLGIGPRHKSPQSDQSLPADYWTLPRQSEVLQREVQELLAELSYHKGHLGAERFRRIRSIAEPIRPDVPVLRLLIAAVLLEEQLEMALPRVLRWTVVSVAGRLREVVRLRKK